MHGGTHVNTGDSLSDFEQYGSHSLTMFKKLTSCLSSGLTKALDYSQTQMLDTLSRRYPDIGEVLEVLERLQGKEAIEGPSDEVDQDDGRWRPILLTVGLLYKLQKIQDSGENSWYNKEDIFVNDDEHEIRWSLRERTLMH